MSQFDKTNLFLNTNWYLLSGWRSAFINAGTSGNIEIFPLVNEGNAGRINLDPFITNSSFLTSQASVFQRLALTVANAVRSSILSPEGTLSIEASTRGECETPLVIAKEGLLLPVLPEDLVPLVANLDDLLDEMVIALSEFGDNKVGDETLRLIQRQRETLLPMDVLTHVQLTYDEPTTTALALFIDQTFCRKEEDLLIASFSLDVTLTLLGPFYASELRDAYLNDYASQVSQKNLSKKTIAIIGIAGFTLVLILVMILIYRSEAEEANL